MNFLVGKRCLAVVFRCMYRKSQLRRRADRGKEHWRVMILHPGAYERKLCYLEESVIGRSGVPRSRFR
jgi:hypothetical protein